MVPWSVRQYGIELTPLCTVEDSQQVSLTTNLAVAGCQNSLSELPALSQRQCIHPRGISVLLCLCWRR